MITTPRPTRQVVPPPTCEVVRRHLESQLWCEVIDQCSELFLVLLQLLPGVTDGDGQSPGLGPLTACLTVSSVLPRCRLMAVSPVSLNVPRASWRWASAPVRSRGA